MNCSKKKANKKERSDYIEWANFYKKASAQGIELVWPSETLVRLFKGDYIPYIDKNYEGKKIIDVGFGMGNNLLFFGTLGMELYGVEVNQEIINIVENKLKKMGYNPILKVGSNRNIPFKDNEFDFLVSWNVLHYEDSESKILEALREYRRVLKPKGRIFVSTTGPRHKILKEAETLGNHLYKIKRKDDFRRGKIFFYFDACNYIHFYFSKYFSEVMVGRIYDFLFTETLDWFIVTGIKK